MKYRSVLLVAVISILSSTVYSQNGNDSGVCENRLIEYSWEEEYGGIDRANQGGKNLFRYSVDNMLSSLNANDQTCYEAYLLVIENILTYPNMGRRAKSRNEDYLVEQLREQLYKSQSSVEKLVEIAPTVNAIWNDYLFYASNQAGIEKQFEEMASSIVSSYCQEGYRYEEHGGDYDKYMRSCTSSWQ